MSYRKTEDTLWLVGGAVMGAAALYLLDPEAGERRRRRVAAAAGRAYENARQVIGETWHDVASQAKGLTHRAAGETAEWRRSAADSAHALSDQARDAAHNVADWMSTRASTAASKARTQARSWLGHEKSHEGFSTGTYASTAAGCCAVGAGMMYFLDPSRGHARRTYVRDQIASCMRSTGHLMHSTGKQLADGIRRLLYGSRTFTRDRFSPEQRIDSEQLISQLRAELEHYSPNARQIQLMSDANGNVTLTGRIAQHEVDGLLAILHRFPGVNHVINRLDVDENPGGETPGPALSASSVRAHE